MSESNRGPRVESVHELEGAIRGAWERGEANETQEQRDQYIRQVMDATEASFRAWESEKYWRAKELGCSLPTPPMAAISDSAD